MVRRNIQKKILIVGGGGFIGSWLVKKLIQQKHKVLVIDPFYHFANAPQDLLKKVINFRKKYLLKGSEFINDSYQKIGSETIKNFSPDVLIHLAAISIEGSKDPEISRKQIVEYTDLTEKVASDVRKEKIGKIIFLSSIFAYGDINDWSVSEKARYHPKTPYGISKAIGELIIKAYLDNWNIIRTTSVYGFGDANLRVVQAFVNKALKKESFWVNKDALLDFTYVKDLVEGISAVIDSNFLKEDFHITSGKAILLPELVNELEKHFPKLKYEIKGELNDRPTRGTMDITKARLMLNWEPKYNISSGMKDYLKFVKRFGHG